jgi:hypothetical protein
MHAILEKLVRLIDKNGWQAPWVATAIRFVQTRGLIVIDSPSGLVACLPTGDCTESRRQIPSGRSFQRPIVSIGV